MNPYHDPKSGRFTTAGGRGGKGGSSGKTAKRKSTKATKNTGGPKLRSGATNKARSKSVTVVNSALANAKSSDFGKKLTAAQRNEIKRDIRMRGMTIPGKRTLAQKTYEHLLLQEGYRG
tara:strand:+ start:5004 stop:5360 length:357 start_codon:yes stop_codon:yes gene_type:complete